MHKNNNVQYTHRVKASPHWRQNGDILSQVWTRLYDYDAIIPHALLFDVE